MHLLTISDIHGRDAWKQVTISYYDKVVFLGDFTDSHTLNDDTIWTNLLEIIDLKQAYPNKIVLLIGNHDAQYMHFPLYRCSGFRRAMQPKLTALFAQQRNLFQLAWQHDNYLLTHAGLSNEWLGRAWEKIRPLIQQDPATTNLADLLNSVHRGTPTQRDVLFDIGYSRGGTERVGGPVWADQSETIKDYLTGYQQLVGHTPVLEFKTVGDADSSITYTDVLGTQDAFYELTIPD